MLLNMSALVPYFSKWVQTEWVIMAKDLRTLTFSLSLTLKLHKLSPR